jgi:hypothetical protein
MLSISSSGAALLFLAAPTWPEPAARHFKEHGSDSSEYSFAEHIVPPIQPTLSTPALWGCTVPASAIVWVLLNTASSKLGYGYEPVDATQRWSLKTTGNVRFGSVGDIRASLAACALVRAGVSRGWKTSAVSILSIHVAPGSRRV